ncbi:MAG: SDR family oxidoreductase [Actinobacteria bacterium]|nr:SDR family oxidoreductase [Actinomycetota bacterium]
MPNEATRAGQVLVAGGTGGLGTAVVRELLAAGHGVTATWLVEDERERSEAEIGVHERLAFVEADLTTEDGAAQAVGAADSLAAVVNLVGGFTSGPLTHETEVAEFDRMLAVNLRPGILLARAAMPRFLEAGGGAYVGVSARPALRPFSGGAPYTIAKAAVLAFVQALDADYRQRGIRCNAILPSVIDTPANRRAQPGADHSSWVPPAEIARVVRFLVSDESAPISGAAVPVYGRA